MKSKHDIMVKLQSMKPKRVPSWPNSLWRASSLDKCMRLQVLDALGVQLLKTAKAERLLTMHSGTHEAVQKMIVENFCGVVLEHDFVDKELHVSGHIDAIISNKECPVIVEVKTLNSFFAKNIRTGKTKPYWTQQVNLYRYYVNNSGMFENNAVAVSLVCTEDGECTVFEEEEDNAFIDTLSVLNACWSTGVLPDRIQASGWRGCENCPLSHICTEPYTKIDEFCEHVKSYVRSNPTVATIKDEEVNDSEA